MAGLVKSHEKTMMASLQLSSLGAGIAACPDDDDVPMIGILEMNDSSPSVCVRRQLNMRSLLLPQL